MHASRFDNGRQNNRMDLIPPERTERSTGRPAARRPEIVDVDFEMVPANGRKDIYPVFNDNRRRDLVRRPDPVMVPAAAALFQGVGFVERFLQRASPRTFAALVGCISVSVFLTFGGFTETATANAPAPRPALAVDGLTSSVSDANGMKVISVYGKVANRSEAPVTVPPVKVDIISGGKRSTVSTIYAPGAVLAPGESRPFATRLPHAGGKVPEVRVSLSETDASHR